MARTVRLDVVTPERIIYSEDVNMIVTRAIDGDLGVLAGHVPLVSGLKTWPLRIFNDEGEKKISVCGGFIEVRPEKITILAGCAELPEEIDIKRAEEAKERAELRLKESSPDTDMKRAEAALLRAIVRLQVAEHGKLRH